MNQPSGDLLFSTKAPKMTTFFTLEGRWLLKKRGQSERWVLHVGKYKQNAFWSGRSPRGVKYSKKKRARKVSRTKLTRQNLVSRSPSLQIRVLFVQFATPILANLTKQKRVNAQCTAATGVTLKL